ncbi:hypothetical protein P691DRAFT_765119 [Macrolepiota fuliginosa MF-IS2]|uniref:Uncharacterized protein n=1 Tax=Macrolepiota fuliginosa MF-IS2 TaxID=1400762 RepID=A0A9P6BYI7_9AGAR|nr:hypothetical protein P691DRAFT_765119 [Macrolepiota fuliginosa MF-IS2]
MSMALGPQNASVPSENWDDDFDFHSQSGSPKRQRNTHEPPATIRMSTATEDWDVDNITSSLPITNHDPPRPSVVLTDTLNIPATSLSDWTETDPSTPQKAFFPPQVTAENWDDDFLDKADSRRSSPRTNITPSRNSIGGKLRAGVPLQHRKIHRQDDDDDEEHESWDDEFDFNDAPAKPTKSSTPGKSQRTPVRRPEHSLSLLSPGKHQHDLSDDEDDADFGVAGPEEDRTVTARSRRAPQPHTPPPPVPSIPFILTPVTATASTSTNTHLSTPFPQSPTASVFSVPTSSVADTTSLRSTAPLRPSLSRNSANNALKYLPPSPPIHRERRRLRKKSRPQPQGMMELMDMHYHYSPSDTEADYRLEEVDERRTPSPPPVPIDPGSATVPQTPSQSTSAGGALLNRIGSVKRWTTRRKRGSTTPSEVAKEEKGKDATNCEDHPTPRPRTSLSSLLHTSQPIPPPPPSSSWFFRSSSPVYSRGRNSLGKNSNPRSSFTGSRSGSMTDLSMRGSVYASSSNYDEDESPAHKTPSKLLKRKSLGFVQLEKGLVPNRPPSAPGPGSAEKGKMRERESDREKEEPLDMHRSKRPMSMQGHRLPSTMRQAATQRHASYGTTKTRKPDASTDDLHGDVRDRKQSTSSRSVRPKARDVAKDDSKENQREKEGDKGKEKADGNRGLLGNMRRLSLVGRHRRTKSGASLTNMEMLTETPTPATPTRPAKTPEEPPSLPPLPSLSEISISRPRTPRTPTSSSLALLPPIELQPPSPPRHNDTDNTTRPPNTLINPSVDSMLSPLSPSSSVPPPSSSTSVSSSFPLSPMSKSPEPSRSPATPKTPKSPVSPYTASLGRSTVSPKHSATSVDGALRRNSLSDLKSDLKIPTRISQAQQGLKRDLGMVRDFAVYIDLLKKQQEAYQDLVLQMQQKLDAQALLAQQPPARAVSPSFFNLGKPKTRARSNTNPGNRPGARYKELAASFYTINSKYRISWECAELLVDLADGTSGAGGPSSSVSAPVALSTGTEKRGRERAITLAGDESKPPTPTPIIISSAMVASSSAPHPGPPPASPPAWRASTGRHDLSHRQLVLLREMLNNAEAVLSSDGSGLPLAILEEVTPSSTDSLRVNRDWRWGDPTSSTITLPSEEQGGEAQKKKRRMSKLVGMAGLRDMLRALKRNHSEITATRDQLPPPLPVTHNHAMLSTASLSTDTSYDRSTVSHNLPNPTVPSQQQGRRLRASTGPEVVAKPGKERGRDRERREPSPSPYGIQSLNVKASPRRPSLASIFRLGSRKHTPPSASVTDLSTHGSDRTGSSRPGTGLGSNQQSSAGSMLEEDWDRMDSASDLDAAARALGMKNLGSGSDGKDGGSTVRIKKGKSPYLQYQAPSSSSQLSRPVTPRRSASGSQLSLWAESPSKSKSWVHHQATPRAPRLSNVDESVESTKSREHERERRRSSSRMSGKIQKSGSVRSMPPQPVFPESRLAMTPENIKPLLENAKEVHARLGDCIMEIRRLLESDGLGERSVSGSSYASASGQSSVS